MSGSVRAPQVRHDFSSFPLLGDKWTVVLSFHKRCVYDIPRLYRRDLEI